MSGAIVRKTEEDLAKELNRQLQREFKTQRNWYLSFAVLSIVLAGVCALAGLVMIALIAFMLGLIFLSQASDANGSLHEVQRRSTKTLVPDFSVLRRPGGETTAKSEASPH